MDKVIEEFYEAFANLDAESMVSCYHENIVFEDPAFGRLEGEHAKNMWRMLIESQKDQTFIVQYSNIGANNTKGRADWKAAYFFSKTGRRVLNKIHAEFEFKDGKIIKHKDSFNLYWWSCQALGIPGYLIGWSTFFQKKLQLQTTSLLKNYESKL
ncbi:MAG: nuclear transport factor 2 family protein [Salibacteraceae bacterium]